MTTGRVNLAVLSIADASAAIENLIADSVVGAGHNIAAFEAVRDNQTAIRAQMVGFVEDPDVDVVLIIGESVATEPALAPMVEQKLADLSDKLHTIAYQESLGAATKINTDVVRCGATFVFILPNSVTAVRAAMEKVILPQLDPRTQPRNLIASMPRFSEVTRVDAAQIGTVDPDRTKTSIESVPTFVPKEKTASGAGPAARLPAPPSGNAAPAEARPRSRTGKNILPRKLELDTTKEIDVARLERELELSREEELATAQQAGLPQRPSFEATLSIDQDALEHQLEKSRDVGDSTKPLELGRPASPTNRPIGVARPSTGTKPLDVTNLREPAQPADRAPAQMLDSTKRYPIHETSHRVGDSTKPMDLGKLPKLPPGADRDFVELTDEERKTSLLQPLPREVARIQLKSVPAERKTPLNFVQERLAATEGSARNTPLPQPAVAPPADTIEEPVPLEVLKLEKPAAAPVEMKVTPKAIADEIPRPQRVERGEKWAVDAWVEGGRDPEPPAQAVGPAAEAATESDPWIQARSSSVEAPRLPAPPSQAKPEEATSPESAPWIQPRSPVEAKPAEPRSQPVSTPPRATPPMPSPVVAAASAAGEPKPITNPRTRPPTPPPPMPMSYAKPAKPDVEPETLDPELLETQDEPEEAPQPRSNLFSQSTPAPAPTPPKKAPEPSFPAPSLASTSLSELPQGEFQYPTLKRRSWAPILIGLGVVAVIGGGIGAFMFMKKKDEPTSSTKVVETQQIDAAVAPAVEIDAVVAEVAVDAPEEEVVEIEVDAAPEQIAAVTPRDNAKPPRDNAKPPRDTTPKDTTPPKDDTKLPPPDALDTPVMRDNPIPKGGGGDCDEMQCVLEKYASPCCAKYKPKDSGFVPTPKASTENLEKPQIKAGVDKVRPRVIECGDQHKDVKGTVKLAITVSPDGSVSELDVVSSPDSDLGQCVASALRKAKFVKTTNGGSFTYPFVF